MAKKVTVIPATINRFDFQPITSIRRRRVAGYARVSTDTEEQATSYEAQVDYYTTYIKSREDWEFVKVYTDEGISATNTNRRDGFNEMVQDALDGKIDLIITKSVSRFARNTVDSLVTVRKLKEKGVEIFFEKENIWTLDAKGELLITIMSSLAQEESRSISENTTWGKRKAFADGKVSLAYSNFLGYDKGPNGEFVINEEQAKIVRLIYKLYLEGFSHYKIAEKLTEMGIPTPMGKDRWWCSTVIQILTNEKYKGDALLQKEYTVDFLTKKKKKNEGEIPQYYVEGHHEPIIPPETFDLVRAEILRRQKIGTKYMGNSIYYAKIRCGNCGGIYGAKVWHSNDKYRRVVYQCNKKYQRSKKGCNCKTPHLYEHQIQEAFVSAFNKVMEDKDELVENMDVIIQVACDCTELEQKLADVRDEIKVLIQKTQEYVSENARKEQDQIEYLKRYDAMVERYETLREEEGQLKAEIEERKLKSGVIKEYINRLSEQDEVLTEFDSDLWCGLVDFITVYAKGDVRVTFKDGTEIKA